MPVGVFFRFRFAKGLTCGQKDNILPTERIKMTNWFDNLHRYFKIAAVTAGGLLASGEVKAQNTAAGNSSASSENVISVPQEYIDYQFVDTKLYYQVDTVYNTAIIDKVKKGTYAGNVAYYDFDDNITIKYHFAGVEEQPHSGTPVSVDVHEGTHSRYSNLYGMPFGKISPKQAYSLGIAVEFNAYLYQTMYEMNKSAEADSIVGLLHDANFDFGNLLQKGWLYRYTSDKQKDRERLLTLMVNNVFAHTYSMMTASESYTKQLMQTVHSMSDTSGIPAKIKEENYRRAIDAAFTIQVCDSAGKVFDLNVYNYLTPENKQLLTKVAPRHQIKISEIIAQNREEIIENTQQRLADWHKVAEQIANGNPNMTVEDVLKSQHDDFMKAAREFTFPGKVHGRRHDIKHRVSEVMVMPKYDVYFHLAPDYYDYMAAKEAAEVNKQKIEQAKGRVQGQNNTATDKKTTNGKKQYQNTVARHSRTEYQ